MAINSKSDACNLALSNLGNFGTVSNIDTPTNDKETTFALWYDTCRQFVLKFLMPNFALKRAIVGQLSEVPVFGYAYFYQYPNNCLKVLGVGNIEDKENNYAIEQTPSGVRAISHDTNYTAGMPVRMVVDVTDLNQWTPEATLLLADYLAAYTCISITQDLAKAEKLKAALPAQMSAASGLNAQENMPVRVSKSRFKQARWGISPQNTSKK